MQWGACKESQCVQEQERNSVGKPFSMESPAGESFAAEKPRQFSKVRQSERDFKSTSTIASCAGIYL
jgi:hypothetical protein